jgi:hypothetical protein
MAEQVPRVVRYYKFAGRPLPVIFVQKQRSWRSYAPGGVLLMSRPGPIPARTFAGLEEIDEAEAKRWLRAESRKETQSPGTVGEEGVPAAPVVYEPRRWRQFVFGPALVCVVIYLAFALWRIVNAVKYPDLVWPGELVYVLVLLGVVLVAVLLSLLRGRHSPFTLALSATDVSGPPRIWLRGWSTIPFAELDKVRSAKRSLAGRLFGWQCLYSSNGRRVVFYRRYFDDEVVRRLLDRLGIDS